MLSNPWVMGDLYPMGHGLYNTLLIYRFPMTLGLVYFSENTVSLACPAVL